MTEPFHAWEALSDCRVLCRRVIEGLASDMSAFETLGVVPTIIQAVEEMDWLLPTDVQDEAIPLILGGGDVLVRTHSAAEQPTQPCVSAHQRF